MCYVVVRTRERCPRLWLWHLQWVRELISFPLSAVTIRDADTVSHLGSTVEVTLMMEVCSDPEPELWKWESWLHYSFLMWWHVWRRDAPSTIYSSSPETGGRAGPHVIDLPLFSCSTQDSDSYTLPGQHSRAVPKGMGVGEPTPRTWKWENWPHLLLIQQGWTSHGSSGELTLVVKTGKSWQVLLAVICYRGVSRSDSEL